MKKLIFITVLFLVGCSSDNDNLQPTSNGNSNSTSTLEGEWSKVLHEEIEIWGRYTDEDLTSSYYTGQETTTLYPSSGESWSFTDSLLIMNGNTNTTILWDYQNNVLSLKYPGPFGSDWTEYGEVVLLTNDSLVISRPLIEDNMIWEIPAGTIHFTDLQINEYFLRN